MSTMSAFSSASAASLAASVTALRSSMHLLSSSISILDAGVSDYPRLAKVLQTTRHFELLPSTSLTSAKATLAGELEPEVDSLLGRVEGYLDKLERREASLKARAELLEGRLGRESTARLSRGSIPDRQGEDGGAGEVLTEAEEVKLKNLRQKKERLSYAVSRLELQAGQRQRMLRKSMAVQGTD